MKLALGAVLGIAVGFAARGAFRRLNYPTEGLYPVASIAAAGLAYGIPEVLGGSGFLGVYLAALILGTGQVPGKRTVLAFHQGLGWVSQIALFFLLGLLVFPSGLADVALEGLLLSAVLMFVARPLAALVASLPATFSFRERMMLGWAGLRGAVPIWLATFPVIAGIEGSEEIFDVIFFVVVTSTLIQGATFEPLARRLHLTTNEPALPRPLVESGRIRRLGGEVFAFRVDPGDAIVGRPVRDLRLPREAIVNVIVRGGEAIPPRGSTEIEAGDELHILVRASVRDEVDGLMHALARGAPGRAGATAAAAPRVAPDLQRPSLDRRRRRRPRPPRRGRGHRDRVAAAHPPRQPRRAGRPGRRALRRHGRLAGGGGPPAPDRRLGGRAESAGPKARRRHGGRRSRAC